MDLILPKTYPELLDQVSEFKNVKVPKPEELLKNFGFKSLSLHAQAPIFYVVDYTQKKYLYLDPSTKTLLGYDVDSLLEAGPTTFTHFWHKSDYKVYNEQIFPKIVDFIKNQTHDSIQNYSFSFNYRIATKDGVFLKFLQRSTFYLSPSNGMPVAAVGFAIDITNFKEDTKIIFTIEKIDRNYNSLNKEPIHKSTYLPEKIPGVLSAREVQVLQCIYEGLSSKQIAEKLFVSVHTINNHRKKMLEKTNSQNSAELLNYATKHGII